MSKNNPKADMQYYGIPGSRIRPDIPIGDLIPRFPPRYVPGGFCEIASPARTNRAANLRAERREGANKWRRNRRELAVCLTRSPLDISAASVISPRCGLQSLPSRLAELTRFHDFTKEISKSLEYTRSRTGADRGYVRCYKIRYTGRDDRFRSA